MLFLKHAGIKMNFDYVCMFVLIFFYNFFLN